MSNEVIAFDSASIPKAESLVHASTEDSAIVQVGATCYPVFVTVPLRVELPLLLSRAHIVYSEAMVGARSHY
jgi:hypothetical protein